MLNLILFSNHTKNECAEATQKYSPSKLSVERQNLTAQGMVDSERATCVRSWDADRLLLAAQDNENDTRDDDCCP